VPRMRQLQKKQNLNKDSYTSINNRSPRSTGGFFLLLLTY
jgi:hypothetical protein